RWPRDWSSDVCSSDLILLRRTAKNTLYVSGKKNLARMPLFSDPQRAAWQQKLEMKASTSYVVDLIPVDWRRLAPNDWKSRFYMRSEERRVGKEGRSGS